MLTFKPATECPDEALPTPVPGWLPSLSLCLSFSSSARPWHGSAPLWRVLLSWRNTSVHLVYGRSLVGGSAAACNVCVCVCVCARARACRCCNSQECNITITARLCAVIPQLSETFGPRCYGTPHGFLASSPMRPPLHPPDQSHTSPPLIHATPTNPPSSMTVA